jgi:hypothetical protein
MIKYYDLFDDIRFIRKWFLQSPNNEISNEVEWGFNRGIIYVKKQKIIFKISKEWRKGEPSDYAVAGTNVPVISKRFGDVVESVSPKDIQRIPVVVEGYNEGEFEILNVITTLDCIDYHKSDLLIDVDDGGNRYIKIRGVNKLRVDSRKIPDNVDIFRISNRLSQVIVSDKIKEALKKANLIKGITFKRV